MGWLWDILVSLGNTFERYISLALEFIFQFLSYLVRVVTVIADVLVQVWKILGRALRDSVAFLKKFYTAHIKGLFGRLLDRLKKLKEAIDRWTKPVRDYLRRVREFYDHLFNQTLRPLLDTIQRLRRVLLVFRIFGFKFATRLDNRLFRLETRVSQIFLDIRRQVNVLSNYLNFILDPLGLLHINQHLGAVIRSVGELDAVLVNSGNRPLLARELESIQQDKALETTAGQRDYLERLQTGALTEYERQERREGEEAMRAPSA